MYSPYPKGGVHQIAHGAHGSWDAIISRLDSSVPCSRLRRARAGLSAWPRKMVSQHLSEASRPFPFTLKLPLAGFGDGTYSVNASRSRKEGWVYTGRKDITFEIHSSYARSADADESVMLNLLHPTMRPPGKQAAYASRSSLAGSSVVHGPAEQLGVLWT